MWSQIQWGTVGEWVSGVFTAAAAFIAVFVYARGRRHEKWAQASLIYYEVGAGNFIVHNGSDRSIVNVRATPEYRSLWSAARSRSYRDRVIFGIPGMLYVSSHEFYLDAKKSHSGSVRDKMSPQSCTLSGEIKPGESASVDGAWVHMNGAKGIIRFIDAHGRHWKYDIEAERLKPTNSGRSPLGAQNYTVWAAWWILKNEVIRIWRRHLYHPGGRPPTE